VLLYYWRRAARIFPAHWASLLVTYVFVLRGRSGAAAAPNAAAALGHYHPDVCPGTVRVLLSEKPTCRTNTALTLLRLPPHVTMHCCFRLP
jgi:hypothetical protein